jgi:hypothetical protein
MERADFDEFRGSSDEDMSEDIQTISHYANEAQRAIGAAGESGR